VSGFPWQKAGEVKELPIKALASNILCKRHNEALACLDDIGGRFVKSLHTINADSGNGIAVDRMFLFNGHDIERWMLKGLCGLAYSKNLAHNAKQITDWTPPVEWLEILFGLRLFPDKWGLYYEAGDAEEIRQTSPDIKLAPLYREGVIYGMRIWLISFAFLLAMTAPPDDKRGTLLEKAIYRPSGLSFNDGKKEQTLALAWDIEGEGKLINFKFWR
jgi:hypothetical protein